MTRPWIDFRKLREQLDPQAVLRHYKVELKRKGQDQLTGFCPIPGHNGKRNSPSFSVNLGRKIFQCFGCGRKGNLLELCCYMEGKDPQHSQELREVAFMLKDLFGLDCSSPTGQGSQGTNTDRNARQGSPPARKASAPPQPVKDESGNRAHEKAERVTARPAMVVNAPLDFELKGLDPDHPYLRERGFNAATIMHFGLGFCNRGLMQGRIVIPLRDSQGKLIGYAGRFTREDQVGEKTPKYLFPGNRERNGTVLEFRKSKFLYNGHAIREPVRDLYVVEGFPSVWWLHQCGFPDVVALMGSSCSPEQAALILKITSVSGRVWLMPDAGEAGERCAQSLLTQVAPHRFCKWVRLDEGQPTDHCPDELVKLLEWKVMP